MTLPEPTPPVTGEAGRAFRKRLVDLNLSDQVKDQYRGAKQSYQRLRP